MTSVVVGKQNWVRPCPAFEAAESVKTIERVRRGRQPPEFPWLMIIKAAGSSGVGNYCVIDFFCGRRRRLTGNIYSGRYTESLFRCRWKKGKQTAALSTHTNAHAFVVERSAGDLSPFRRELEPVGGGSLEIGLWTQSLWFLQVPIFVVSCHAILWSFEPPVVNFCVDWESLVGQLQAKISILASVYVLAERVRGLSKEATIF